MDDALKETLFILLAQVSLREKQANCTLRWAITHLLTSKDYFYDFSCFVNLMGCSNQMSVAEHTEFPSYYKNEQA